METVFDDTGEWIMDLSHGKNFLVFYVHQHTRHSDDLLT